MGGTGVRVIEKRSREKSGGKSPGWKQGEKRSKRKTYPIAKKSHSRAKKSKKKAA